MGAWGGERQELRVGVICFMLGCRKSLIILRTLLSEGLVQAILDVSIGYQTYTNTRGTQHNSNVGHIRPPYMGGH